MANAHSTLTSLFQDIADKIKMKTGSTDEIIADGFPIAIEEIMTALEATAGDTATAADIAEGATAHVRGVEVTGTLPVTAKRGSYGFTYSGLATSSVSGTLTV